MDLYVSSEVQADKSSGNEEAILTKTNVTPFILVYVRLGRLLEECYLNDR
jgi:hypothetical protein